MEGETTLEGGGNTLTWTRIGNSISCIEKDDQDDFVSSCSACDALRDLPSSGWTTPSRDFDDDLNQIWVELN